MTPATNILERILQLVPGYSGYADRQAQRRSDTRLRTRIARELLHCEAVIQSRLHTHLDGHDKDLLMELEHCRRMLNTLTARIRYAPLGTSGMTSEKRLAETELNEILRRDMQLLEFAAGLSERIDEMATRDIITVVDRIHHMLEERNEYIREFN
ncbi:hypothetical protein KKH27_02035 [bacterium]|nr:hypothetical protein [bacterium]MBU1983811.1 hypothetical protein [bacterium]